MVLNCDFEYGLSSEVQGRLWLLATSRSTSKLATGLERIEVPRSGCGVSAPGITS